MAVSRAQLKLLLIIAIFLAPVVLATVAYKYWRPERLSNYGELVEPVEFAPVGLQNPAGGRFDFTSLRGKWVFVLPVSGECDSACVQNLYLMRQVRLMAGREQERVERLLIAQRPLVDALAKEHPGLHQASYSQARDLGAAMAGKAAMARVYLIDPLGRLVLRFPAAPDGRRMHKDLERLLKYSQIG